MIIGVYTTENFRGRDIAESLIKLAIEVARERGALEVWLNVNIAQISALNLYRKLGFVFVKEFTKDSVIKNLMRFRFTEPTSGEAGQVSSV